MNSLSNIEKINDGIKNNKPIMIKNFLRDYNVDFESIINDILDLSNADKHYYTNGVYTKNLDSHQFIVDIKNKLNKDSNLIYNPKSRYWIHPKGNYTNPHYDGDGTNVLNICLQGKKKFILSPPNSHMNFSFTNLSILDTSEQKYEYILEPNDLLLIPSFWYHEVYCLEESTITINIIFVDSNIKTPYPQKVKYFFHKLLDTSMNKKSKAIDLSTRHLNLSDFIFDYVFELVSLILIFLLFNFIGKKLNIYLNEIVLICLLLFALYTHYNYNGISIILTSNYLLIYIVYTLLFFRSHNQLTRNNI